MPDFYESLERAMREQGVPTEQTQMPVIVHVRPGLDMHAAMDLWQKELAGGIHGDDVREACDTRGTMFVPAEVWDHGPVGGSPLRPELGP